MTFFAEPVAPKTEFKLVPPGLHLSRCYRLIDLGTHGREWNEQMKFSRWVSITWEIHGEDSQGNPTTTASGAPLVISGEYNFSWNENSKLRRHIQGWRGTPWTDEEAQGFDLEKILGGWCMLNIIQKPSAKTGKMFANVDTISPVPAPMKKAGMPKEYNKIQLFRLADPDWELFETFSPWIKNKIEASPEYRAARQKPVQTQKFNTQGSGFEQMDDDIPF